jgi:hypothetical protein
MMRLTVSKRRSGTLRCADIRRLEYEIQESADQSLSEKEILGGDQLIGLLIYRLTMDKTGLLSTI